MELDDEAPRPRRRWLGLLVRLALFALLAGLLWRLFARIDGERLRDVLAGADWRLVALGAAINLVVTCGIRIVRFHRLLGELPRAHGGPGASLGETARLLYAGWAANAVLPARAGEALRGVELYRRHGYPLASLVAVMVLEKVFEVAGLALFAVVALVLADPPGLTVHPLRTMAVVGAGALALTLLAPRLALRWPRLSTLRLGLELAWRPRVWMPAFALTLLFQLTDMLNMWLCLNAVGIDVPVTTCAVLMICVDMSLALPLAPGNVGVLEGASVLVLAAYGAPESDALGYALLYHLGQLIPAGLAGLGAFGLDLWLRRRR